MCAIPILTQVLNCKMALTCTSNPHTRRSTQRYALICHIKCGPKNTYACAYIRDTALSTKNGVKLVCSSVVLSGGDAINTYAHAYMLEFALGVNVLNLSTCSKVRWVYVAMLTSSCLRLFWVVTSNICYVLALRAPNKVYIMPL